MGFLSDLVREVRRRLDEQPLDEAALQSRAASIPQARDLIAAIRSDPPAVIAEVKRASPSAGSIDDDVDPVEQARAYEEGGAAAISVLTESTYFHGTVGDLQAVAATVDVPVLRKDFLVDPAQLLEARAHGADAVLLIAACLTDLELTEMLEIASRLGLGALVEAHTDDDLDRVLASEAPVIGVNARDLETLAVDVRGALARLERIPAGRLSVFESAISTRADVDAAVAAGASAVLVGEALMRAANPASKLRELRGMNAEVIER